ncbi:MAG: hypothetical protein WAX89_02225, partial [Alphaproteobacteria bacterium]
MDALIFSYPMVILAATLLYVLALTLVGRCLAATTAEVQVYPLALSTLAGLGVAVVAGVVAAVAGASAALALTGFVLVAVLVVVLWGRRLQSPEHTWLWPLVGGLLLGPLWLWLANDVPTQTLEMGTIFPALHQLWQGVWPLELWPSQVLVLMPFYAVWPAFTVAVPVVLNPVLLALSAQALAVTVGIRMKWSNLPLVAAGSVLGITVFNPLFTPAVLRDAHGVLLQALAWLLLAMPLTMPQALPRGLGVLPFALVAALLAMAGEWHWPLLLMSMGVWIWRTMVLEVHTLAWKNIATTIAGWVVLACLPLCMVLLWQRVTVVADVPTLELYGPTRMWVLVLGCGALVGGLLARVLQVRAAKDIRVAIQLLLPWLVPVLLLATAVFTHKQLNSHMLAVLQLVLLVPVWTLWQMVYPRTVLQKWAFISPWGMGGVAMVVLLGLVYGTRPLWQQPAPVVVSHGAEVVAQAQAKNWWPVGAP